MSAVSFRIAEDDVKILCEALWLRHAEFRRLYPRYLMRVTVIGLAISVYLLWLGSGVPMVAMGGVVVLWMGLGSMECYQFFRQERGLLNVYLERLRGEWRVEAQKDKLVFSRFSEVDTFPKDDIDEVVLCGNRLLVITKQTGRVIPLEKLGESERNRFLAEIGSMVGEIEVLR